MGKNSGLITRWNKDLYMEPKVRLKRDLGLFEATTYGVGIILGAGIYVLIGQAAELPVAFKGIGRGIRRPFARKGE